MLKPKPSTVVELNTAPTQKDKKSPASTYSESSLMRFTRVGFPKEVLRYTVANTNSMEPWIDAGDIALVRPLGDKEEPVIGEVYVFKAPEFLVIHRLIDIRGTRLVFRGDNNYRSDPWITTKKDLVGQVFGVLWGKKQLGD
jgi:signal peptidase I